MFSFSRTKKQLGSIPMMTLILCGLVISVGVSCGSQEDKDRELLDESQTPPPPGPIVPKKQGSGDSLPQNGSQPPLSPPDESLTCSSALELQTEINPELHSGTKTLLVGSIDPSCSMGRIPVLWLSVTSGFRIHDAINCERSNELTKFNYKCTGVEGQFQSGSSIVIPVSLEPGENSGFQAEIELIEIKPELPFQNGSGL